MYLCFTKYNFIMKKIVLIHAVDIAIEPIKDAFSIGWPEADIVHLWDETLSIERAKTADLTPALSERVNALFELAKMNGADAVLFTCSAFGEAIERLAVNSDIPVLKPNQAMFDEALAANLPTTLLGTFQPAMAGMEAEFIEAAKEQGKPEVLDSLCVPEARTALKEKDIDSHNQYLLDGIQSIREEQVIMLAHFSSAVAQAKLQQETGMKVLSSPECAVRQLKKTLTH